MRGNRELQLALLLVLAGAALVLLSSGRPWVDLVLDQPPPLPSRTLTRTGGDVVAALSPLGVLGLAGVAALAATRGLGRVLLGALLLIAGAAACVATVAALTAGAQAALGSDVQPAGPAVGFTGWPYPALAGGLLLTVGGWVVAARGRRWAALSERYEAPASRAERPAARPEVEAWEALDRGEDPTRAEGAPPA